MPTAIFGVGKGARAHCLACRPASQQAFRLVCITRARCYQWTLACAIVDNCTREQATLIHYHDQSRRLFAAFLRDRRASAVLYQFDPEDVTSVRVRSQPVSLVADQTGDPQKAMRGGEQVCCCVHLHIFVIRLAWCTARARAFTFVARARAISLLHSQSQAFSSNSMNAIVSQLASWLASSDTYTNFLAR